MSKKKLAGALVLAAIAVGTVVAALTTPPLTRRPSPPAPATTSTTAAPFTVFEPRPDAAACAAAQAALRQITAAHTLASGLGADQQRFTEAMAELPVACTEAEVVAFQSEVLEPWLGPRRAGP